MRSLSLLSSLKAKFCALVKLGLGGWEDLRTLLISALSSSASCWLSLVQAASMAVMYSKVGGCLGVTAKLGPLARTDLWAGVKGLLERLMTHLWLGSSLEEPWGGLLGGGGGVAFPGDGAILLGRLGCPVPGWMPTALPDWPSWIANWPAWGELVAWRMLLPLLGRWAVAWEALLPSLEGRWAIALEELLPSPKGRGAVARGELLPLLGGRWAIARGELRRVPDWDWLPAGVELLPSWVGRRVIVWEELLPSPEGRGAVAGRELLPLLGGRWAIARRELRRVPDWDWLPAGVELLPSWVGRRVIVQEELLPSPEGRRAVAGRELLPSPGGRRAIAAGELGGMPDAWLLAGVELMAWEGLLTSLEGRRVLAWLLVWDVLLPSLGGKC